MPLLYRPFFRGQASSAWSWPLMSPFSTGKVVAVAVKVERGALVDPHLRFDEIA
jgi:hypothetical protein